MMRIVGCTDANARGPVSDTNSCRDPSTLDKVLQRVPRHLLRGVELDAEELALLARVVRDEVHGLGRIVRGRTRGELGVEAMCDGHWAIAVSYRHTRIERECCAHRSPAT